MDLINKENLNEARKEIDKLAKQGKKVIVHGRSIEFNREILEIKKVNMLILEHKNKRDKLKQRDSGLNEVLCKLARDKNITFAIDFREIQESTGKERAKILGRIIQNIKLIKKFKNKLEILNKPEDKLNLAAFLRTLGADTKMASEASI